MKHQTFRIHRVLGWIAAFSVAAFGIESAQPTLAPPANLEAQVDAYLKPYLETNNFSGAVLIARRGEVLLSKGYGPADRERRTMNTPQTKFHLASVSKPFTTAAIMLLVERGLMRVQDPVSAFIPDYPNGDRIRVHHLLTNTSGIPHINNFEEYDQLSQAHQTPASLVAVFKDKPLQFEPGAEHAYSNSNYNLLAYLIEQRSGMGYGAFLQENLFAPLGMVNSGHDETTGKDLAHSATGYAPVGVLDLEPAPSLNWSVKTGNGSLYTSAEDLYVWNQAFFGGKVLKPESLAAVFTDHIEGNGYGWFLYPRYGKKRAYINGRSPGYNASYEHYVDDEVTIIVLSNVYNALARTIGGDLAAMLFGEAYEIPQLKTEKPSPDIVRALVGTYQFGPDFYRPDFEMRVYEQDGYLYDSWSALVPLSETAYVSRAYWSQVSFDLDAAGNAIRMHFDDYSGERVP